MVKINETVQSLVGQTLRAGQQSKSSGLSPLISIVRFCVVSEFGGVIVDEIKSCP